MNTSASWNPGRAGWIVASVATVALLLADGVPAVAQGACPDWNVPARQAQAPNPIPAAEADLGAARDLYQARCATCHGATGENNTPVAMNLNFSCSFPLPHAEVQKLTDGELYFRILEGRSAMPNSRNTLRDEERWLLVHYMRALASGTPAGN